MCFKIRMGSTCRIHFFEKERSLVGFYFSVNETETMDLNCQCVYVCGGGVCICVVRVFSKTSKTIGSFASQFQKYFSYKNWKSHLNVVGIRLLNELNEIFIRFIYNNNRAGQRSFEIRSSIYTIKQLIIQALNTSRSVAFLAEILSRPFETYHLLAVTTCATRTAWAN